MTEVELAKQLKASNYTCEGVSCDECKKTNYLHVCLMADVRLYCDEILGKDNYINRLKKENAELKRKLSEKMSVYLAIVYINDCIDNILVFETLEKAGNYKKIKDHHHPGCEIKVRIEQYYVK